MNTIKCWIKYSKTIYNTQCRKNHFPFYFCQFSITLCKNSMKREKNTIFRILDDKRNQGSRLVYKTILRMIIDTCIKKMIFLASINCQKLIPHDIRLNAIPNICYRH